MIDAQRFLQGSVAVYRGQRVKPYVVGKNQFRVADEVVGMEDLDEMYRERLFFRWRGEEFVMGGYKDGILYGRAAHWGLSIERARELGLFGNPREGWGCEAPEDEIESVSIETYDTLGAWRDKKAVGDRPNPRFYTTMILLSRDEFSRL